MNQHALSLGMVLDESAMAKVLMVGREPQGKPRKGFGYVYTCMWRPDVKSSIYLIFFFFETRSLINPAACDVS